MLLEANQSQLLLIDIQPTFMELVLNQEQILANANKLAQMAKLLNVPIWGTEHCPDKVGGFNTDLAPYCQKIVAKDHFSAYNDAFDALLRPPAPPRGKGAAGLPKHLRKEPPPQEESPNCIVIAGIEAHVCVLQTALELLDEEFDIWLVTDACGSRRELDRDAAFDRLAHNGAELVTTEMVLFEWLRSAKHPHFKTLQQMIKS